MSEPPIDAELCESLALRAADGEEAAARQLVEYLWPSWIKAVRSSRSMGALASSEDHVHNVVARLVEKIVKPAGRGLRLYKPWRKRNADKGFEDWMRIVLKNAIRDYVRERFGRSRRADAEPSLKHLLNEFASSLGLEDIGVRPPITAAQTARELLEFATNRLPPDQLHALRLWLEGGSFEDIGAGLEKSAEEARRLLRAGVATLRREFVGDEGELDEPV